MLTNDDIKQYKFFHELTGLAYVDRIILYGSRARNTNQEKSDIDLAIFCPKATDGQWYTLLEIIEEADTLFGIDCVRLDVLPEDDILKQQITTEGKILWSRTTY